MVTNFFAPRAPNSYELKYPLLTPELNRERPDIFLLLKEHYFSTHLVASWKSEFWGARQWNRLRRPSPHISFSDMLSPIAEWWSLIHELIYRFMQFLLYLLLYWRVVVSTMVLIFIVRLLFVLISKTYHQAEIWTSENGPSLDKEGIRKRCGRIGKKNVNSGILL